MGILKWFRRQGERIADRCDERRFARMGLSRTHGEREYPREPGEIDGIEASHLERYQWAIEGCGGATVLDFGCGVGYGSFLLSHVAEEVVGFDVSADALKWAREYAAKAENLSFTSERPDRRFDRVVCFECIEHVPDADEVLDWIAAHLDGQLYISTPIISERSGKNKFHLREFTQQEFEEMLGRRFVMEERRHQDTPFGPVMLFRCRAHRP